MPKKKQKPGPKKGTPNKHPGDAPAAIRFAAQVALIKLLRVEVRDLRADLKASRKAHADLLIIFQMKGAK